MAKPNVIIDGQVYVPGLQVDVNLFGQTDCNGETVTTHGVAYCLMQAAALGGPVYLDTTGLCGPSSGTPVRVRGFKYNTAFGQLYVVVDNIDDIRVVDIVNVRKGD